jgi:hypothetical protein
MREHFGAAGDALMGLEVWVVAVAVAARGRGEIGSVKWRSSSRVKRVKIKGRGGVD